MQNVKNINVILLTILLDDGPFLQKKNNRTNYDQTIFIIRMYTMSSHNLIHMDKNHLLAYRNSANVPKSGTHTLPVN